MQGSAGQDEVATALSAFGQASQVAIEPLVDSLGSMSLSQPALQTLRNIDPGLLKTTEQLGMRLANADEYKRLHATRVLALLGKDAQPAAAELEKSAAGNDATLAAWSAYTLWKIDASKYSPIPALPILIDALEEPRTQHLRKISVLSDLAAMGPNARPAIPSIIKAINRGDFGASGTPYLLKIDLNAALQAGLVTGLSPEFSTAANRQSLGSLVDYFDADSITHSSTNKLEYDAQGNVVLLHLRSSHVSAGELAQLTSFSNLRELNISHSSGITDRGLAVVSQLSNLETLDLTGCTQISDATLKNLSQVPSLTKLMLRDTHVTSDGLRIFSQSAPLAVDPASLDAIRLCGLEKFKNLGLKANLGSDFLLKDLVFSNSRFTAVQFQEILAGQTSLRSLIIRMTVPVTDAWLISLKQCPHLESLELTRCKGLTAVGLAQIGALYELRTLLLESTGLGDDELLELSALHQLEVLDLSNCPQITDQGVFALANLRQLRELRLLSCRGITIESLPVFASLPELTFLNLGAIGLTSNERKEIQKALPNCRIQF